MSARLLSLATLMQLPTLQLKRKTGNLGWLTILERYPTALNPMTSEQCPFVPVEIWLPPPRHPPSLQPVTDCDKFRVDR